MPAPDDLRLVDERVRIDQVGAAVGRALTTGRTLHEMLQRCVEALVGFLDGHFARIWVYDEAERVLVLRASAGRYEHLDGPHARIPIGADPVLTSTEPLNKVAQIALTRAPLITERLLGDPLFTEQQWIRQEHLRAFAGYPLVVEDRLIGVLAMFSTRRWPSATAQALASAADVIAVGIRRKQNEDSLEASERRFHTLFDQAPYPILVLDPSSPTGTIIVDLNDAACEAHGYRRDELVGQPLTLLDDADTRSLVPERIAQTLTGPSTTFEVVHRRKDGSVFPVEVRARPVQVGDKTYIFAIERDLAEHKRLEAEQLRTQKLESLGLLAGGIAHDFNNFLTAIMGGISLAQDVPSDEAVWRNALREALAAARRASELTRQLLTFSRGGTPLKRAANLVALVNETAQFALAGSPVRAHLEAASPVDQVAIDSGQLSQVITNLLLNAAQAMPAGGVVRVGIANVDGDGWGVPRGHWVELTIADHGCGIPQADLTRVFDPYFSTKPSGTGLGLATSHSIIQRHGGEFRLTSQVGVGTTVRILLEAARPTDQPISDVHELPPLRRGRVLVMDDDPQVARVLASMLRNLGLEPTTVADGQAAIRAYLEARLDAPYDLVFMDLTVPGGMGGKEAVAALLEADSEARVVVCSGYSHDPVMAKPGDYGFVGVLPKPFTLAQLAGLLERLGVAQALDPAPDGSKH